MSLSLVNQNRIAQFAARFEVQPDGMILYYHPGRHSGGIRCTQAECADMIQAFANTQTRSSRWMLGWVIVAGFALGILEAAGGWSTSRLEQIAILLAPFPLLLQIWYHASRRPLQILHDRPAWGPPRTVESAFWGRVRALPASFFALLWFPNLLLLYYHFFGKDALDATSMATIGAAALLTLLKLYAHHRQS